MLRPKDRAAAITTLLEGAGARAVSVPAVEIVPPEDWDEIDRFIRDCDSYSWVVFTSVSGVDSVLGRGKVLGRSIAPPRVAAIGPATARSLSDAGINVGFVPERFTTEALGEELPGPPGTVASIRAEAADARLDDALTARGFAVDRFDAYRTLPVGAEEILREIKRGVDAVVFTSPSIVSSFVSATAGDTGGAIVVCIGPATADACRDRGLKVGIEAGEHTMAGLVEEMNRHMSQTVGTEKPR